MYNGKNIKGDVPKPLQKNVNEILRLDDWRKFADIAADFQSSENKWMNKRLKFAQRQAQQKAPLSERYKKQKQEQGYGNKPLIRTGKTYKEFTKRTNFKTEYKQNMIAVKLSIPLSKAKQMIWLFNAMRRKKSIMNIVTPEIMNTLTKRMMQE